MKRWHHCMSNNAMPMVGDEVNRDSTDDCPLASGRRGAKRIVVLVVIYYPLLSYHLLNL
jgi:hypothetical protein